MSGLFSLKGKTALVTGSSRGLGFAFASGLAEAGASVIVNGSKPEGVAKAAAELRAKGYTVYESSFDVTNEAAVTAAFEDFDTKGLAIDILVNNAGIQFRKPMIELAAADWRRVVETNLTSAFLIGREAAKRMIARKSGGKIINIGSLTSEAARPTVAPYTASKGGVKMLTRSMTAEWAEHNIQANAIGPGYIATEMNTALTSDPAFDAWVKGRTPAKRWGKPEDLIGAVVFLSSPASDFMSGQIIYVDGGFLSVM